MKGKSTANDLEKTQEILFSYVRAQFDKSSTFRSAEVVGSQGVLDEPQAIYCETKTAKNHIFW